MIISDNCSIFTKTWWPDIFYCENVRKRHKIYYTKGNKDGFTWICSEDVIRVWSQNSQVHFTSWLNIETCGMYYMCYVLLWVDIYHKKGILEKIEAKGTIKFWYCTSCFYAFITFRHFPSYCHHIKTWCVCYSCSNSFWTELTYRLFGCYRSFF